MTPKKECGRCPASTRAVTVNTIVRGALVAMLAHAGQVAASAQTVEHRLLYPGAAFPGGTPALGDFDGDGDLDLVSAGTRLLVYFNDGAALREPVTGMTSPGFAVATGDLDLDGDLDIVSAAITGLVIVGLNDGNGQFERSTIAIGNRLTDVALGDLNGDGILDAVVADGERNEIVPVFGLGDGTFTAPDLRYALSAFPAALIVADFNDDGHADVLTAEQFDPTLTLLKGDGTGALMLAREFDAGAGAFRLAFEDIDGDGDRDIMVPTSAGLSILRNLGGGEYADFESTGAPGVGIALAIGDVDGDGDPDVVRIALNTMADRQASVMINDGTGGFTPLPSQRIGTSAGSPVLVDVDGDGDLDLATRGTGMTVLLNDATGQLRGATTLPTLDAVRQVAAADFTADGVDDLVAANFGDASFVSLHESLPGGGFAPAALFPCGTAPMGIAVADFDGDSLLDVVTANSFASNATVLLNTGGAFGDPIAIPSGGFPYGVAAGDVNGDGVPDVVTPSWASSTLTLSLGNGDGTFQPGQTLAVGRQTMGVALGDINGDGVTDLVTANGGEPNPSLLLGRGDGVFGDAMPVDVDSAIGHDNVAIGDLDDDGFDDAAFVHDLSGEIRIAFGGPGGLESPRLFTIDGFAGRPAMADVDDDGITDLVVAESLIGSVYVLRGRRDRDLDEPLRFTAGRLAASVAVGDFNSDGLADLAVSNMDDRSITILLNPRTPCPADLDGDGALTLFDFLAFQNAFDAGDPIADFDGDGEFTIFDFLAFQNAFDAGCD